MGFKNITLLKEELNIWRYGAQWLNDFVDWSAIEQLVLLSLNLHTWLKLQKELHYARGLLYSFPFVFRLKEITVPEPIEILSVRRRIPGLQWLQQQCWVYLLSPAPHSNPIIKSGPQLGGLYLTQTCSIDIYVVWYTWHEGITLFLWKN